MPKMNAEGNETHTHLARDPASDPDSIGLHIQHARVAANLSVTDLSRNTGISKTVIHGYERGRTKPGARELRLLSIALKVSPNRLLFGTDEFDPNPSAALSVHRKLKARPELAGMYLTMILPVLPELLDLDEIKSVLTLVESIIKTRYPDQADALRMAFDGAIEEIDKRTTADGSFAGTQAELSEMVSKQQQHFAVIASELKPPA